jgi:hypothetical protein
MKRIHWSMIQFARVWACGPWHSRRTRAEEPRGGRREHAQVRGSTGIGSAEAAVLAFMGLGLMHLAGRSLPIDLAHSHIGLPGNTNLPVHAAAKRQELRIFSVACRATSLAQFWMSPAPLLPGSLGAQRSAGSSSSPTANWS